MTSRLAICLSLFIFALPASASADVIDILEGDRVYPGQKANIDMVITEPSNCTLRVASRKASARVDRGNASLRFMVQTSKRARPGKYPVVVRCGSEEGKTAMTIKKRKRAGKSNPVKSIKSRQKYFDNSSDEPTVTPQPIFVSDFPATIGDGQPGWVAIHYSPIGDGANDLNLYDFSQFAAGASTAPVDGVTAVPLICGQRGGAEKALAKAGVAAPVYVWTAADCQAQLNARFAGLAKPDSGRLRLLRRSDGRPLASYWMIRYAIDDKILPSISWANLDLTAVSLPNIFSEAEGSLRGYERGDTLVQSFWDGCPSCRKDESEYQLQGWLDNHPGAQIIATSCANKESAGQWAYERGWRFPVVAYGSSDWSGVCWQRIKDKFGFTWYGDKAFLRDGVVNNDAYNSFKGVP